MPIFDYTDADTLGHIVAVDANSVVVSVTHSSRLKQVHVNRLIGLQSSKIGQHLIGVVSHITRRRSASLEPVIEGDEATALPEDNLVHVSLIGTLADKIGLASNVFGRAIDTIPAIDASCFLIEGDNLTRFMQSASNIADEAPQIDLGKYSLDEDATAFLNGNRFFQRPALIVGNSGSGKSWTTARLLDKISDLPQANVILFDVHGEYKGLVGDAFRHFRIAGSADVGNIYGLNDGVVHLPFWLLEIEEINTLLIDSQDPNAPNQSLLISQTVKEAKRSALEEGGHLDILQNLGVNTPVPFDLDRVVNELVELDREKFAGSRVGTEKLGEYNGKLSRLIARLDARRSDRRLGFLFQPVAECYEIDWLARLTTQLVGSRSAQQDQKGGIKIVDFSDVPPEMLPLAVSLLARLIYVSTQWTPAEHRHPVALMCDGAHLYMPEHPKPNGFDTISGDLFEEIAEEGRRYGVGLTIISQRPAEVNHAILSQCQNIIAMRLTNHADQSIVKHLFTDSLGGLGELLPTLHIGEALIVGDASLMPTRVRVGEPKFKPTSATQSFWDRWGQPEAVCGATNAVYAWRRQSLY